MDTFSGKKNNPYKDLPEKKLISKSKDGDTKAFDELINRHDKFINSCINSFLKGNVGGKDTDEIYQLTLIKSWRYIGNFRGDCKFSTWLNKILRNLFYDDFRRKQRRKEVSYEGLLAPESPTEPRHYRQVELKMPVVKSCVGKAMDMKKFRQSIHKSINKLSDKHKEVVLLFAEEELSYKDIAEKIGCSVGTVMSRLFYARKYLKKHFKEEEIDKYSNLTF